MPKAKYRIERIRTMEEAMDRVKDALDHDLPLTSSIQNDLAKLQQYCQTEWIQDYEADEQGLLPKKLKRGILSEDALYDLLAEADQHWK